MQIVELFFQFLIRFVFCDYGDVFSRTYEFEAPKFNDEFFS
jgi:hypothetical protein